MLFIVSRRIYMSADAAQKNIQSKSYRSKQRWFYTGLAMLFLGMSTSGLIGLASSATDTRWWARLTFYLMSTLGLLGLIFGILGLMAAWNTLLKVTPKGIVYHAGFYVLQSDWKDVEGIRDIPEGQGIAMPIRCLWLRNPQVQGWVGLPPLDAPIPSDLRNKVVPLTSTWEDVDDLVHEIQLHSSH
jgi:protein-S-isoprenylcysteine O-methyltransferase Ste14